MTFDLGFIFQVILTVIRYVPITLYMAVVSLIIGGFDSFLSGAGVIPNDRHRDYNSERGAVDLSFLGHLFNYLAKL